MPKGEVRLDFKTQKEWLDHLFQGCLIRLGTRKEYETRANLLARLSDEVSRGEYSPQANLALLSSPKGKGVPRFTPVLSWRDYAVYFGCVRALDEPLAHHAVPGTFGGWSLGGRRRRLEGAQAQALIQEAVDDYYGPASAYDPAAWVQNWNQFWKLLLLRFNESGADNYFVMFDIANFYDSIDLPRLERQLRYLCPEENFPIEVLFYLLGIWNNKETSYARSSKGLPQDVIGDCSRVLANGYLLEYDAAIMAKCDSVGAKYMRYADDMIINAPNESECAALLFVAAEHLNRLGLNINVSKVTYLTRDQFNRHWGFDVMSSLESPARIKNGVRTLRERWDDPSYARRDTALRRAITQLTRRPDLVEERTWVYGQVASDPSQVVAMSERQMVATVTIAPRPREAFDKLTEVVTGSVHSGPKVRLLRCAEILQEKPGLKAAALRVGKALGESDDPVVRLASSRSRAWRRRT